MVRLLQKYQTSGNVSERQRSGRPRKTSVRQDRALGRRARMVPLKTGRRLREKWTIPDNVSVRTVTRIRNATGQDEMAY